MLNIQENTKNAIHLPEHIRDIIQRFATESKDVLHEHLLAEYLFGSYARGTYTPESDIDILLLVDQMTPEIRRQMSGLAVEYSLNYNIYISPIIKDRQVWRQNQEHNTLFYQNVMYEGISL
jgi:uncharacterized protein